MKKILSIILIVASSIATLTVALSKSNENIGEFLRYSDMLIENEGRVFESQLPSFLFNDRLYVPLRDFCTWSDFALEWVEDENKVKILNNVENVSLGPDSATDINMDFSFVKKGMSIDELSDKVGSEPFVTGSGVTYYRYSIKKDGVECILEVVSYSEPIVESACITYLDDINKKIVTFEII